MRKKKSYLIVAMVIASLFVSANSLLFAQSVVLTETKIKEDDNAVKMLFSTNRSIPVECYDLSVPPQIIIDFMGEIYTNKPEIMMVNKGVVKQMRVIRGTKKSQDLDDSFYSVDFIIIDLKEAMRYDFNQGLTTSVLLVSKPGKRIDAKKEFAKLAEKPKPAPAPVKTAVAQEPKMPPASVSVEKAAPVSVKKRPLLSMEDKEYEMPVKPLETAKVEKVKKTSKKKKAALAKKGRVKKIKKRKTLAEKSEAKQTTTVGKMKKAIKNFFTFGKSKKKKGVEDKQIKEVEKPKPATKKEVKAKKKSRKRRHPKEKKIAKKRKRPKRVKKVKRGKKVKKTKKITKAMREEDAYKNAIAEAKALVEQKAAELKEAEKEMALADENLKKADAARKSIGQRIKDNNAKQKALKAEFNESLKLATFAKNVANATWMEYSDAKAKLSLFLKNDTDAKDIEEAQKIYEEKKVKMSQAIKDAESAKAESEAKLALYEKAVQEGNDLLLEADQQKEDTGKEQMLFNAAEEKVFAKKQELADAKKAVVKAERAYQQYEIEKTEEEYKKSLFNIDETLALEAEKERRKKEEERLKRIEQEKAEQMKIQQEKKAKEEARMAALKQLQKDEESEQKKFLRRKKEKIEPKRRRAKPLAVTESKPQPVQAKTEVLQTAVELRNSGLEMQRAGDFDSAIKYYQQALISDPKYATVHNDLGILYEQKGLDDKAKMEYLNALKINPHYIRAHSNLALLYEKSGDNNKAYYHWKQRAQLGQPDDPWTQKAKKRMELLEQQRK